MYSLEVTLPGLISPHFYFLGFVTFEDMSKARYYLKACAALYKRYEAAYCGITEDLDWADSLLKYYSPFYLRFVETFGAFFRVPPWMVCLQQEADSLTGLPVNVVHETLSTAKAADKGAMEPATKKCKSCRS
jgi:hypothetical protein